MIEKIDPNHQFITGIDLGGDPRRGKFNDLLEVFDRVKKMGLKLTIHSPEVESKEETTQIVNYKPNRIGHFIFYQDSDLK